MKLIINKDRSVIPVGTWGTVNENNYEILDFEFPAELEEYNKRIVYYLGDEKVWDAIVDNKAYITNAITTKGDVKAYVWCTKENTEREADTDFRTQLFEMNFYENENADGIVPTPEQVDGFNTMLTAMNAKIDEVDALEQTIETAEAERQENENTRISNESTRQSNESTRESNEETRQTQEAERERKTSEAIADIKDKTAEYNANAEEKTNEFNDLVETQKLVIENYADTQLNAIYRKGQQALGSITTTTQFALQNISLAQQTGVSAVETASSEATTNFNTNATNKTNAFNDNATQKTTNFDNNASEKTDEFNTNAQNKIDEYDEHIVEYQAQIDELQEEVEELSENMPWNETEQGTYLDITDAAKYSKNKLELFGNTEQTQYTGKNLYDYENSTNTQTYNTNAVKENNGFRGGWGYRINLSQPILAGTYTFSIEVDGDSNSSNANIKLLDENKTTISNTSMNAHHSNNISFTTTQDIHYIQVDNGNSTNTVLIYNIQIEEGSTATKYEPYVGGAPSPSPDYPQDIHVVTGNNSIGVQGKNLFDKDNYNIKSLNAGGGGTFVSASNQKHIYIQCKPNTDYVVVKNVSNIPVLGIYETENEPAVGVAYTSLYFSSNSNGKRHVTTSATAQYLDVRINTDAITQAGIDAIVETLIIAEGTNTNISYVPYYHADYPINLGLIELCKIGDYQDYLYKENGNWYLQKNTASAILPKPTTGTINTGYTYNYFSYRGEPSGVYPGTNIVCSHLIGAYNVVDMRTKAQYNNSIYWGSNGTYVRVDKFNTVEEYINALSTNDITIIGRARTPITTQITDTTLISQLDAIYEHLQLVKGTNNITVTAEDLAPYMELTYMQDLKSKLDNLDSRLALLE